MGREEKLQAHRVPVLHRAFSVFVLDGQARCWCNGVQTALRDTPSPFTAWFPVVLERLRAWLDPHPTAEPAAARRVWRPTA